LVILPRGFGERGSLGVALVVFLCIPEGSTHVGTRLCVLVSHVKPSKFPTTQQTSMSWRTTKTHVKKPNNTKTTCKRRKKSTTK
jgi:hypothetical protein